MSKPTVGLVVATVAVTAFALAGSATAAEPPSPGAGTPPATGAPLLPVETVDPAAAPAADPAGPVDVAAAFDNVADVTGVVWRARTGTEAEIRFAERTPEGWADPVVLSAPGEVVGRPSIDVGRVSHGHVWWLVTWLSGTPGHAVVEATMRVDDGAWYPPIAVSTYGTGPRAPLGDPVALVSHFQGPRRGFQADVFFRARQDDPALSALWVAEVRPGTETLTHGGYWWYSPSAQQVGDPVVSRGSQPYDFLSWTEFDGSRWRGLAERSDAWAFDEAVVAPAEFGDVTSVAVSSQVSAWTATGPAGAAVVAGQFTYGEPARTTLSAPAASATGAAVTEDFDTGYVTVFWREASPDGSSRIAFVSGDSWHSRWLEPGYLTAEGGSVGEPVTNGVDEVVWTDVAAGGSLLGSRRTGPTTWTAPELVADPAVHDPAPLLDGGWVWTDLGGPAQQVAARGWDGTGPRIGGLPGRVVTSSDPAPLSWSASEFWSAPTTFEVQTRTTGPGHEDDVWATLADGLATPSTDVPVAAGLLTEVRVRGTDAAGNVGDWKGGVRIATPFDDRTFTRAGAWTEGEGEAWWQHTFLRSKERGARLSMPGTGGTYMVRLLAEEGPGRGRISVQWHGHVTTYDLDTGPGTEPARVWLTVPTMRYWTDETIVVRVLSAGRPVRIDGIAALGWRHRLPVTWL